MKRLLRILFNALTVLSLLLCVATTVLWVRSANSFEYFFWIPSTEGHNTRPAAQTDFFIYSSGGFLNLDISTETQVFGGIRASKWGHAREPDTPTAANHGFGAIVESLLVNSQGLLPVEAASFAAVASLWHIA